MSNWLYVSGSGDGWRNLGVDEYFIETLSPDDMLLYFYINRSAVIIGRGQNPWAECNLTAMDRDGVQVVRRITGGGAVFHDEGNLNFSFIAGENVYDVQRQLGMIMNAVRALGIECDFTGRNDLLAEGRKFSGNAFCRRKKIHQHHGTLLIRSDLSRLQNYLNVDPRKLVSKGVASVRSRVCNLSEFKPELTCESMLAALKEAFRAEYGEYTEITSLDEAAVAPYVQHHASDAWRLGETPRFDVEIENRFPWGNAQLLITLRKGHVSSLQVYSDALDADLPGEIESRLIGAEYGSRPMAGRLMESEKETVRELAQYILEQNF